MNFADLVWRFGTVQSLAVASAGGAAASTGVFGTQTYAVRVTAMGGTVASTAAVRIKIGSLAEAPVANSTTDALLTVATPHLVKVVPGEKLSAIGNDGGTYTLNVVELLT